jgi:excisionase family DNA binding protein
MSGKLTVKQAAGRMGVSPSLVYALCGRRLIRHERHGLRRGKIVIPEDAVEEYCRRRTVEAGEGTAPDPAPVRLRSSSRPRYLSLD